MRFRKTRPSVSGLALVGLFVLSACGPAYGQVDKAANKKASPPPVEKDLPYADGGDQQMLDLFLPDKRGFTTIVFTYGGGWRTGSRKSVKQIGEQLQSLGYGCALLSHRLARLCNALVSLASFPPNWRAIGGKLGG
jgi:acetyl esterase/lipase